MAEKQLSFFARVGLAYKTLVDASLANTIANQLHAPKESTVAEATKPQTPAPVVDTPVIKSTAPDSALQLLGLLQQEGRLIDFLQEDVTQYSDSDIGAAARVVHQGLSKAIKEHITIEPVRTEQENSAISIPAGFDATQIRLTGNVVGQAPYKGTLVHRGWQVSKITLPKISDQHNLHIIAPAEVEL